MVQTNFEKLEIYRLAETLSDRVWNIVSNWNHLAQNTIGVQLVRAADSIGANIAEGSGRGTSKDYLRFLKIGRGSLYETKHWLRRAFRRGLLSEEEIADVTPLMKELLPRMNAYIGAVSSTRQTKED